MQEFIFKILSFPKYCLNRLGFISLYTIIPVTVLFWLFILLLLIYASPFLLCYSTAMVFTVVGELIYKTPGHYSLESLSVSIPLSVLAVIVISIGMTLYLRAFLKKLRYRQEQEVKISRILLRSFITFGIIACIWIFLVALE
jgi:hypothetical protein